MIIITLSNWKKKLKILILLLLLGVVFGTGYTVFQKINAAVMGTIINDRDARGSLKVNAEPEEEAATGDDWWGEFIETLKVLYQE